MADPLDRVLGYVDFRKELIEGAPAEFTCLVGTMTQEIFYTSPAIRAACAASIFDHAAIVEADIAAAMKSRQVTGDFTAASLAQHIQAVLQGAFILAKASGDRMTAIDSVDHLKRYLVLLFQAPRLARKGSRNG